MIFGGKKSIIGQLLLTRPKKAEIDLVTKKNKKKDSFGKYFKDNNS
jgi:hypothetical protein